MKRKRISSVLYGLGVCSYYAYPLKWSNLCFSFIFSSFQHRLKERKKSVSHFSGNLSILHYHFSYGLMNIWYVAGIFSECVWHSKKLPLLGANQAWNFNVKHRHRHRQHFNTYVGIYTGILSSFCLHCPDQQSVVVVLFFFFSFLSSIHLNRLQRFQFLFSRISLLSHF